jgi:sugar lactone lactonase YvrE
MPARRLLRAWALLCLALLSGCGGAPNSQSAATRSPGPTPTPSPSPTATPGPAPNHYTAHILLRGGAHPDDLAFDQQGRLLFSDERSGTVSRLNADGSVTVLLRGLPGPEGIVVLPDGTMILAEQETHRIVSIAPGSTTPVVIRNLPGTPSAARCKAGVDGIALDPTTNTLIVPDSPAGEVYRMSLDGHTFTLLASGIVRPVGAVVDGQGIIYVADECGGALWRITPSGGKTRIGGFGMLDDAAFDPQGDVVVIDLDPRIHALIRLNLATGQRQTLASAGFIEPQGLVVDAGGNIFVSDDASDRIVEYIPG